MLVLTTDTTLYHPTAEYVVLTGMYVDTLTYLYPSAWVLVCGIWISLALNFVYLIMNGPKP